MILDQLNKWSFLLIMCMSFAYSENLGSLRMPKELANAQIDDKAGAKIPLDIALTNQDGGALLLGDYFSKDDKRPVIVTLGYYGCPMLCTLVLNGLVDALKELSFKAGNDYRIVSISIDHREDHSLAKKKQEAYLNALGGIDPKSWTFHVGGESEVMRLADALGFNYYYDKKQDQFAHGAGFFVLSPDGILSRTFFGIAFKASDIKLALNEAADGKIGSFIDRIILSCFHYNPDSHRYGIYIFGVMRLAGLAMVLIMAMVLFWHFRGEKQRSCKT